MRAGEAPAAPRRATIGAHRATSRRRRWCASSSTDDGIGLPQEDRERLTEPYVTHKPKGTGLGLAIVKKIMEDHGGRLVLDDRDGWRARESAPGRADRAGAARSAAHAADRRMG